MKRLLKILLPIVVLAAGLAAAKALNDSRELPESTPPEVPIPLVATMSAQRTDHRVIVPSRGTVVPRTESQLVVEVSGRVTEISPQLVSGGFFEKGEQLLRIDSRDYELAAAQAKLDVASADRRLAEELADAAVAKKEWERMGSGEASALTLREPQVAEARATLVAAQAMLERAERDLERTKIMAPFAGRVRHKAVDLGQYVNRGVSVATVYATDIAEVRLPLPDDELEFLTLPFGERGGAPTTLPEVVLSAQFAGARRTWPARVVRTEGEIDPTTRMVMAVAQVEDPYGRQLAGNGSDKPRPIPLALGMFVDAQIRGHLIEDVFTLPRTALRDGDRVYVLDEEDRLRFFEVEVIRRERELIIVRAGLDDGTRVVISPIEIVTDGMQVRDVAGDVSTQELEDAESASTSHQVQATGAAQ